MTDRRSFLARCLGLAAAPLLPIKALDVPVNHGLPAYYVAALARYSQPGKYGEWTSIPWSSITNSTPLVDFRTGRLAIERFGTPVYGENFHQVGVFGDTLVVDPWITTSDA